MSDTDPELRSADTAAEESAESRHKAGRKLLAVCMTVTTAASLLFAGLFDSPADVARRREQAAPTAIYAPANPVEDDEDEPDETDPEEKTATRLSLRERFARLFQRLPSLLRVFAGIPLWALGTLILWAFRKLTKAVLSPLWLLLLKWLLAALLLLGLLYLLLKLIFPDLKLKEIFCTRTLLTVLIGTALLGLLNTILGKAVDSFGSYELLFDFIGGLLVLFAAAAPVIRKHRRQKQVETE